MLAQACVAFAIANQSQYVFFGVDISHLRIALSFYARSFPIVSDPHSPGDGVILSCLPMPNRHLSTHPEA